MGVGAEQTEDPEDGSQTSDDFMEPTNRTGKRESEGVEDGSGGRQERACRGGGKGVFIGKGNCTRMS